MLSRMRGFTLPEVLLALAIGSLITLGAMRFLPALQRGVLVTTQRHQVQTLLWQLAMSIGKSIRRAGYCNGECSGPGLWLAPAGNCLVAEWDFNSNGQWETAPAEQAEQVAYRHAGTDLETRRGGEGCGGRGWQRMNDPAALRIDSFRVWRLAAGSPLVAIAITGGPATALGGGVSTVQYTVHQRNWLQPAGGVLPAGGRGP